MPLKSSFDARVLRPKLSTRFLEALSASAAMFLKTVPNLASVSSKSEANFKAAAPSPKIGRVKVFDKVPPIDWSLEPTLATLLPILCNCLSKSETSAPIFTLKSAIVAISIYFFRPF